jgi:hypothetical protein
VLARTPNVLGGRNTPTANVLNGTTIVCETAV